MQGEGKALRITTPIPVAHCAEAARLWRRGARVPWVRTPAICPAHGLAAIAPDGALAGVAGLRDARGGFLREMPATARLLFRPAPDTACLVIDGIVARHPRRGVGTALLERAAELAHAGQYPGLQAEVATRNRSAMAFYAACGFAEVGRGPFGWPWTGPVAILRRPV